MKSTMTSEKAEFCFFLLCSEHVRCVRRRTSMAFYELPRTVERESHLTWVSPGIYLKCTVV